MGLLTELGEKRYKGIPNRQYVGRNAMRKLLIRIAFMVLSFLLTLVLVEIGLGFTNMGSRVVFCVIPGVGVARAPSQKGVDPGNEAPNQWVPLTINSLGFRGPELPATKSPGEIRIHCLGDSFVFGGGLGDSDTFPALAQRMCERSTPRPLWINGGGNGYDAREAAAFLEHDYARVRPEIVIFGWNWNDLVSINGRPSYEQFDPDAPVRSLANFLHVQPLTIRRTALFKFYDFYKNPRHWVLPTEEKTQKYRNDVLGAATGPDSPDRWELSKRALGRMNDLCKKNGAKFFVLIMPELTWKESGSFVALPKLVAILNALKIPYVDAQPAFYEGFKAARHLVQSYDPTHPSAEGQRTIAEVTVQALAALQWIPAPEAQPPGGK
jgi:hypothetical protein